MDLDCIWMFCLIFARVSLEQIITTCWAWNRVTSGCIKQHNVMFRFPDPQLLALSRSSGNLEDLEIRISAAQRHMYDGYQVYWMCGLTSIEFNSYQEMAEIWNTLKLIFQLHNIWVYIIVLFINNIFACLKSVFQTKSPFVSNRQHVLKPPSNGWHEDIPKLSPISSQHPHA